MSSAETFEGAEDIRRSWLAGLAPDPAPTVSQWADRHRVLSSRSASEAGPYRTSRTPYLRGIMDALSPRKQDVPNFDADHEMQTQARRSIRLPTAADLKHCPHTQ